MAKKYVIGVDSGTTRIKAVLFDLHGEEIANYGIDLTAYTPYEDWYEQDMNEIWQKGAQCIKEVASGIAGSEIAGIGLTGQGDGLWMIDSNGEPVRKGICFCDGRTGKIIDEWRGNGTLEAAFDICGTAVFGSSMSAEMRWIEENEPEAMEKARWCFHLKDWLFYKLTGKVMSDDTDMCLPMLNVKTKKYDDELLEIFGISHLKEKLPPIDEEEVAPILPEMAEKLGLDADTVIAGGPMDISAAALSCGAIKGGDAVSIIGTAAIHEVVLDEPDIEPRLLGMTPSHCRKDLWLRLLSSLCGAPNLEWFLHTLGGDIVRAAEELNKNLYDYCGELIERVPIGSNGVVYYPFLLAGGERAPFFKSNIKAGFNGISFNTKLEDMLRAVYEGVGLAMRDCYGAVPREINEIIVTGGGSNSPQWMQMFADITGKDIVIYFGKEHSARGAAMHAAVASGLFEDYGQAVAAMSRVEKRYVPNKDAHKKYDKLYNLYKAGYEMSMDWWDLRSDFLQE